MCQYIEIHGDKHFLYKDLEELKILKFLLNPRKHELFFPALELLIPRGEEPFSPIIIPEKRNLIFMGYNFPYISFESPCPTARIFKVVIENAIFYFHTDRHPNTEKLLAVRQ